MFVAQVWCCNDGNFVQCLVSSVIRCHFLQILVSHMIDPGFVKDNAGFQISWYVLFIIYGQDRDIENQTAVEKVDINGKVGKEKGLLQRL